MSETILAGVGKVDITCYGKDTIAALFSDKTKAHIPKRLWNKPVEMDDPLYARALVLDDGHEKVILITMDITAIGARTISQNILSDSADDFMPNLRRRIEQELGIPGGNVCVTASHTHPPGRLLCDDNSQIDKTLEAINQALQNMVPVTIGIDSGYDDTLTFNRTLMMKDGSDYTIRACNPCPLDDKVDALRPIDPEIGILRIDRLDGRPFAVVYNFATHLLLGSPKKNITADHVGVTSQYLEDYLGNGAMAFFLQGAGGDISEVSKCDIEQPVSKEDFGVKLGLSILKAYKKIETGPAKLRVVSKNIEFPFRTDIPDVIAALKQEQAEMTASLRYTSLNFKTFLPLYLKYSLNPDYPSHFAYRYMQADACGNIAFNTMDDRNRLAIEKYLDSIEKMERMARNEEKIATLEKHQEVIDEIGTPTVPAEIQGIKIGECVLISAPMEVLAEVGLKVKETSPFKNTYIASLSNGYLHYAPPASYYERGGYEVTECLLSPEWEKVFEKTVMEIFEELNRLP